MSEVQLLLNRDFSRFLDKEDFPHEVSICLGTKTKVTCSGLLLAQQSSVLEDIMYQNNGLIELKELSSFSASQIMQCMQFLYGVNVAIDNDNIDIVLMFSSCYEIKDLFSLAFNWIIGNMHVKNFIHLYEICLRLPPNHKYILQRVLDTFFADNLSDVVMEVRNFVKEGHFLSEGFLMKVLKESYSSGGDVVLDWLAQDPQNSQVFLNHITKLDVVRHFPMADDFTRLMSYLSDNADSKKAIKVLMELQQTYFLKKTDIGKDLVRKDQDEVNTNSVPENSISTEQQHVFDKSIFHKLMDDDDHALFAIPNIPIYASKEEVTEILTEVSEVKGVTLTTLSCYFQFGLVSFQEPSSADYLSKLENLSLYRSPLIVLPFSKSPVIDDNEKKVFIKRIPSRASKKDIERCFAFYGAIRDIEIIRHKKCAFIESFDTKMAKLLIHLTSNGVTFKVLGQRVLVERFKFKQKSK